VSTVNILEVEVLENIVEILDSDGAAVSTYYTNIDIKGGPCPHIYCWSN